MVFICIDMQPYAEVCSILHSYSAFSFQLKLPVVLRYCKDPDAEKRKASPCRFHAYRTASGLQTSGGLQVCLALRAWNVMQFCRVTVGNGMEWAPFSASIFWLISAPYDSFCAYSKQKPACVISGRGIFLFSLGMCIHFSGKYAHCFASKCAKWKDTKSDAIALTWEKFSKQKAVKLYTATYSNICFCLLAIRGCRYVRYVSKWFKMLLQHVAFFALQVEEVGLALDVLMRTSAVNERNIWII